VFPWHSDYFQKLKISYQCTRHCSKPPQLPRQFSKCITAVLKQSMNQFRYVTLVLQIIFWKNQISTNLFMESAVCCGFGLTGTHWFFNLFYLILLFVSPNTHPSLDIPRRKIVDPFDFIFYIKILNFSNFYCFQTAHIILFNLINHSNKIVMLSVQLVWINVFFSQMNQKLKSMILVSTRKLLVNLYYIQRWYFSEYKSKSCKDLHALEVETILCFLQ